MSSAFNAFLLFEIVFTLSDPHRLLNVFRIDPGGARKLEDLLECGNFQSFSGPNTPSSAHAATTAHIGTVTAHTADVTAHMYPFEPTAARYRPLKNGEATFTRNGVYPRVHIDFIT